MTTAVRADERTAWPPARRLAIGCEQLGGHAWGAVEPAEVEAALLEAVDRGITLFDTADVYGRGESERRLGQLFGQRRRESLLVATKFGVRLDAAGGVTYDSSPDWAEKALHGSLDRLQTDYVDLFQVHYWDGRTPIESTFERLESLRARGAIRHYGTTNFLPQIAPADFPGFVSVSHEFSLANRRHEADAGRCADNSLTFLSYGSLAQGILSGKYDRSTSFGANDRRAAARYVNFHGARLDRNLRIVEVLRGHAASLGRPMSQLAIAWILARLPASVAIVGIKRPAQLEDAIQSLSLSLPLFMQRELDEISSNPGADHEPGG